MAATLSTFSGTYVNLFPSDHFMITSTGQLDSYIVNRSDSDPLTYIQVLILGEVLRIFGIAVTLSTGGNIGNHSLTIGSSGQVFGGKDNAAVVMEGEQNAFFNAGLISGGAGIFLDRWAFGGFQNQGDIVGSGYYGVQVANSSSTVIENSGLISGFGGVILNGSVVTILNQGAIRSHSASEAAVDADIGASILTLRNSGEVFGVAYAVQGSVGADAVVNSGLIDGNVELGAGNDTFRGKQGTLLGTLSGGAQNDFLAGGEGDQLIYGGSENDILNGNAGDDVLFGGNGYDTFVFSRRGDDDTINGFQNGTDLIDMRAFHFANFAALSAKAIDAPGGMLIDLQSLSGGTVFIAGFTKASFDVGDVLL